MQVSPHTAQAFTNAPRRYSASGAAPGSLQRFEQTAQELCQLFLARLGDSFWRRLADCTTLAHSAGLNPARIHQIFAGIATRLATDKHHDPVSQRLHPLLLEIQARLGTARRR